MIQGMPDIYSDNNKFNPMVTSPNAPYAITFYMTADIINSDAESFKDMLDNAVYQFRHSRVYTNYKSYLYELGLDRCQVLSGITSDMAKLEMHHNGITIFDIAMMIAHHFIATTGRVCTFDIIRELRYAHTHNLVPLVMLCRTAHQLYHNNDEFFIPASMCIGFWTELLRRYNLGITYGLAKKINFFIEESLDHDHDKNLNSELLSIRQFVREWSEYNEYAVNNNSSNRWTGPNSN